MGYQPGLDGLRALSVVAVLLYHGGFSWMHGGFFGVEVFFVVSGFLITSLLLDERERNGAVSLGQFWLRRAQRLLPALVLVLVAVGVWAALWGTPQVQSDLRRDYPWAIFYAANWGQIVGGAQYFGNLSPLRHLWSLAVEEQWYLLWPLGFLGLARLRISHAARGRLLLTVAATVMAFTWWAAREPELTADRVNLLYLSTFTRSSGLLLGAGAAFLWRPWRRRGASGPALPALDVVGVLAVVVLGWSFATAVLTDRSIYRWHLALVTIASVVAVMVVVHPGSRLVRGACSWRPLVELGKRSYGLYLWSWPVSVALEAYSGEWSAFVLAMAITVVVSELSYRFVETPIRRGALGRWFVAARGAPWRTITAAGGATVVALAVPLVLFYGSVADFDVAAGGADVEFELAVPTVPASATVPTVAITSATATATATAATATTAPTPPVTAPVLPRRVVVVGDSMAHSLAINLPSGIESTFAIADGSVEGCSVYDDGSVRSQRSGFTRSFADCAGWADRWRRAAADSQSNLALVVLGAWDVFDVEVDGALLTFATPEADARFTDGVQQGIDALAASGAHVGLLEIACMRPQDVEGAGVPALPERGDDVRIAHLNDLLRGLAAAQPDTVTFVPGPVQWCTDDAISSDLGYRWDGVHVYRPGAKLIYESIAPSLLAVAL